MTNEYSVKIKDYISEKILDAEKRKTTAEKQDDFATQKYYEGQLKELYNLREYLTENIDLETQRYY